MATKLKTKNSIEIIREINPYEASTRDLSSLESNTQATSEIQIEQEKRRQEVQGFIDQLTVGSSTKLRAGDNTWEDYENLCLKVIELTTQNEFKDGIKPEKGKNQSPFPDERKVKRKDIFMKNEFVGKGTSDEGSMDHFWVSVLREFDSVKFAFECKNYSQSNKISWKEVYQLYQYLHPEDTGRIGFLLCRYNSFDKTADEAIRRLMRDKYRIVPIYDSLMIDWLRGYISKGQSGAFFQRALALAEDRWSV